MQKYDAAIIGAGIVGTAVARWLSRYDLNVALIDKGNDVSMGATKANSAIVHGGYAESGATLRGRLCYPGRLQFKRLNEELNFGFDETGSLVVTMEDDPAPLQRLLEQGRANGLDDLEIIGQDRLREMEPALNPDLKWALYCRGAGICSPYEMAIALAENAIANGVTLLLEHEVVGIQKEQQDFIIETNQGEIRSRFVINTAGVYADQIARMVGIDDFEILPRSGQYLLFVRGSGKPINSVIFQLPTDKGKGVVLTSTYYGNLMIGPDASDESSKEDTSTDVARIAAIYHQCRELYDKIDPRQFIRSFTGIRARSSTNDFIIEESRVSGFVNVAGIQSPGLTAAPAIADMVMDILEKAGLKLVEKTDFDPYRPPIIQRKELRPRSEIEPLLHIPSSPEKVICRCEQVTEGEIVDALHRGIKLKTIDAVKRRTRASMGWCQGGFCRSRIAEVMEREYGEPIDPSFDIEHSGVSRVERSELIEFLNSQE